MSDKPEFWFNIKTQLVESGPKSLSLERIGPFPDIESAQAGPDTVIARAKALREEDEKSGTTKTADQWQESCHFALRIDTPLPQPAVIPEG